MLQLVGGVAEQCGGWAKLIDEWAAAINDENASVAFRLKAVQTITFIAGVAEARIAEARLTESPETTIRTFHKRNELAPVLQKLFREGAIDYDTIDPPGAANIPVTSLQEH